MQFIITDWMSHVCFDSDNQDLPDIETASDYLDECLYAAFGDNADVEEERQEYSIEEYNESIDRILYRGNRLALIKNYYNV
jgi:hypothetical protein